ncbi:MAG TPA: glycosyltransferase family 2 protein [Candidatus Acidoferrales bacterium]
MAWESSLTFLFGAIATIWLLFVLECAQGVRRLPRIPRYAPLPDEQCPKVSILFSARDEEEKLPQGLATMQALDYPHYEIIAVNDRSSDATGRILDEAAARDPRLKVIHIRELPAGWLGKPHGLQRAYEAASGEWLLFTDADVRMAPGVLRRTMAIARERGWDHLTAFCRADMTGFWDRVLLIYFGLAMTLRYLPWRVSGRCRWSYMGVGAFQMMQRSAYEAIGAHRRLAMEVIDDLKLGKLVKAGGFRSGVCVAEDWIQVRWHDGVGNIIRGLTKNSFASSRFSLPFVLLQCAFLLQMSLLPFVALAATSGWPQALAGVSAAIAAIMTGAVARDMGAPPLYGLTHALGSLLLIYVLLRSSAVTLRQGGIVWRDTFYPLDELRKGRV